MYPCACSPLYTNFHRLMTRHILITAASRPPSSFLTLSCSRRALDSVGNKDTHTSMYSDKFPCNPPLE